MGVHKEGVQSMSELSDPFSVGALGRSPLFPPMTAWSTGWGRGPKYTVHLAPFTFSIEQRQPE